MSWESCPGLCDKHWVCPYSALTSSSTTKQANMQLSTSMHSLVGAATLLCGVWGVIWLSCLMLHYIHSQCVTGERTTKVCFKFWVTFLVLALWSDQEASHQWQGGWSDMALMYYTLPHAIQTVMSPCHAICSTGSSASPLSLVNLKELYQLKTYTRF